ncbi:amino acid permease/ SLC12A domain-containing protein [Apiospora saccharicola]|uniref:Amino acid permease/ SLC12A domain-containing protein n=1 Tax=Apiospora saccharicola TaxID=335842 RepID=A0ABR1UIM9_9PEZI
MAPSSHKSESKEAGSGYVRNSDDVDTGHLVENSDGLSRRLNNRQIQLIAIGGSIGTALFVSIGQGLYRGGPASLFIAYLLYSCILGLVNNCMAEMATYMPVSGGFIRMAGKWVDEAFGFMAGWNFFLYEALLIPFEITALNIVLSFWRDDIPAAAVCCACIVLYAALNMVAVRAYGEAEFWLSGGKFILCIMLFSFTLVTMCGGNPQHDAYGFRHWSDPGPFREYRSTGDKGRFEGFLAALFSAAFTIVGPEYISMVSAEAKRPSIYIKTAFKTVYYRFGVFFIMGALCVGIVVPYNAKALVELYDGSGSGAGTAAASPYVIAMNNLGIGILPDVTNALMLTSIFSAGNTYTYAATRSLYGLALEGRAPHFLRKTLKNGVPIWCFAITMCFPVLSFLSLSSGSSKVLTWLVTLITAGGIINFIVMCVTYIFFYRACMAQGIDRQSFPYTGWFQPYSAYIALAFEICVVIFFGYTTISPWSARDFFINYMMVILAPLMFIFWKVFKRTSFVKPLEADIVWDRPIIEAYEASFTHPPVGFFTEILQMVGLRRNVREPSKV